MSNPKRIQPSLQTQTLKGILFIGIVLLSVVTGSVNAAPVLELTAREADYELPIYMDILEDKTQSLTIYDVSSEKWSGKFVSNTRRYPNFGFSSSAFWARMQIKNSSRQIGWMLVFLNSTLQTIDNIKVYLPGEAGTFRSVDKEKGIIAIGQMPGASMFILSIPPGQIKTVYIRVQDEGLTLFNPNLFSQVSIRSLNQYSMILNVILGIIIFFSAYNLLLFLSLKDKVFLFYSGVLMSEVLILLLLWLPDFSPGITNWWLNRINGSVYLINGILWLLVIRAFFQKTPYGKNINKLLLLFIIGFLILMLLYFKLPFRIAAKSSAYDFIAFAGIMVLLSLFSWSKKLVATRYFSLGMLLLALTWCGLYLNLLGYVSLSFGSLIAIRVSQLVVVLLFFSFALLDNYKLAENKMIAHMREADQLKDDFLANTSHELRTPLHGIIGLSEDLLSDGKEQPKQDWRNTMSLIITSGRRLTRLIDDILDFSKIKRNDLHIARKPTDFKSVCSLAVTLCRPMIGQKKLQIKTELPDKLHYVMADEDRLQQIMINLLSNAIKFTPSGEIRIAAEEKKGSLWVSVKDSGIGIPEEKLSTVFNEFTQADGSMHREYGGTGLGLAISRKLIDLHGGTIRVESHVKSGSVFTFSLPLAEDVSPYNINPEEGNRPEIMAPIEDPAPMVRMARSKPKTPISPKGKRILIVDDDAVGLYTLENHLLSMGYEVSALQDGFAAWIKVQKEVWDLVVLDIMMPGMSGFDLCKNIRSLFNMTELPVIMLTARIQMDDMIRGFDCGANDYVTKPVNREELLSRIQTSLQLKQYADLLRENQVLKEEIIKRKRAEKDLSAVNQQLIALLDIWETGIIVIDHHQCIRFFNQKAAELFGHSHHEVITRPVDTILNLPELPSLPIKNRHSIVTATRADRTSIRIETIVTPIDVNGDLVYAILCRDASGPAMEDKIDIVQDLELTHRKIQVLQSAFDSALRFLDQEGKQMASALQHIECSMEDEFAKLSEQDIDKIYRHSLVELMTDTLDFWSRATGKDKIQFAEESKIWRAYLDVGTFKTRTLDKYLDVEKLPKNPRWKDVVKSAEFVLDLCTEPNNLKDRLHTAISKLHAVVKVRQRLF